MRARTESPTHTQAEIDAALIRVLRNLAARGRQVRAERETRQPDTAQPKDQPGAAGGTRPPRGGKTR